MIEFVVMKQKQGMKKAAEGIALFIFLCASVALASAEKFGGSFSDDYLTKDNQQSLTKAAPVTQPLSTPTSIPPTSTSSPTILPSAQSEPSLPAGQMPPAQAPVLSTQPVSQQQIPSPAILATPSQPVSIKSPYEIEQPKITVPKYEERLMAALAAEQQAKIRKKMSLIDSIVEEATKYGLLLVLCFVVLVVVYAMRKETKPPMAPPGTGPTGTCPADKKDIWHEEF